MTETRAIVVAAFQKEFQHRRKADDTIVTDIDLAVEQLVRWRLAELFPSHGVIGEEFADQNKLAEFTWVIDPIDGTSNLRHRVPLFGTILALLHDGKAVLGLIDLPLLGRLYSGGAGLGAWCNDKQLHIVDVADDTEIASEIISVGGRRGFIAAGMPHVFDELMHSHRPVRTYGDCFGHALVVEGAVGAMVEGDLHLWDIAATEALVHEAGGTFVCVHQRNAPSEATQGGETDSPAALRYDVLFGKPRVVDWITRTLIS